MMTGKVDVCHLLCMCHVYVKLRVKVFSIRMCLLPYTLNFPVQEHSECSSVTPYRPCLQTANICENCINEDDIISDFSMYNSSSMHSA
jgi:hypothetical protein